MGGGLGVGGEEKFFFPPRTQTPNLRCFISQASHCTDRTIPCLSDTRHFMNFFPRPVQIFAFRIYAELILLNSALIPPYTEQLWMKRSSFILQLYFFSAVFKKIQSRVSRIITTVNTMKTWNGYGPHKERRSVSLQIPPRVHRGVVTLPTRRKTTVFSNSDKVPSRSSSKEYYAG